jgi:hypothetical protein
VACVEAPLYSPTNRTHSTIGITYTYDPEIAFHMM